MLVKRTEDYLKFSKNTKQNKNKDIIMTENISVNILKKCIEWIYKLNTLIELLNTKQNKQYLPGFSNKRMELKNEINTIKLKVQQMLRNVENFLNAVTLKISKNKNTCLCKMVDENNYSITLQQNNLQHQKHLQYQNNLQKECSEECLIFFKVESIMLKNIFYYFTKKYNENVYKFRNIQQVHMNRSKDFVIFDNLEYKNFRKKYEEDHSNSYNSYNSKIKETAPQLLLNFKKEEDSTIQLEKDIFKITTTLIELKNVLYLQEFEIDSIDIQIDKINRKLENANEEVLKFKNNNDSLKDKTILSMMLVIFILIILIILKYNK